MNEYQLKYPCCTCAPRPIVISNMDAAKLIISYYTAPICENLCRTAILQFGGIEYLEHKYLNDENNEYILRGYARDSIHIIGSGEYLILMHNEYIIVKANSVKQFRGEETASKNALKHITKKFERA